MKYQRNAGEPPENRRKTAGELPRGEQEQKIYRYVLENAYITRAQVMTLDFGKAAYVIERGYQDALAKIPELRERIVRQADTTDLKQRRAREILFNMIEDGWLRKEGASRSTIYVLNTTEK